MFGVIKNLASLYENYNVIDDVIDDVLTHLKANKMKNKKIEDSINNLREYDNVEYLPHLNGIISKLIAKSVKQSLSKFEKQLNKFMCPCSGKFIKNLVFIEGIGNVDKNALIQYIKKNIITENNQKFFRSPVSNAKIPFPATKKKSLTIKEAKEKEEFKRTVYSRIRKLVKSIKDLEKKGKESGLKFDEMKADATRLLNFGKECYQKIGDQTKYESLLHLSNILNTTLPPHIYLPKKEDKEKIKLDGIYEKLKSSLELARELEKEEEYAEAIQVCEESKEISKQHRSDRFDELANRILNLLVRLYQHSNNIEKIERTLIFQMSFLPKDKELSNIKTYLRNRNGEKQGMEITLLMATHTKNKIEASRYFLIAAKIAKSNKKIENAIVYSNKAIYHNKENIEAHKNLLDLYRLLNDKPKILEKIKEIVNLIPNDEILKKGGIADELIDYGLSLDKDDLELIELKCKMNALLGHEQSILELTKLKPEELAKLDDHSKKLMEIRYKSYLEIIKYLRKYRKNVLLDLAKVDQILEPKIVKARTIKLDGEEEFEDEDEDEFFEEEKTAKGSFLKIGENLDINDLGLEEEEGFKVRLTNVDTTTTSLYHVKEYFDSYEILNADFLEEKGEAIVTFKYQDQALDAIKTQMNTVLTDGLNRMQGRNTLCGRKPIISRYIEIREEKPNE